MSGWNESSIDCYKIGADCSKCQVRTLLNPKFKCFMSAVVADNLKKYGKPVLIPGFYLFTPASRKILLLMIYKNQTTTNELNRITKLNKDWIRDNLRILADKGLIKKKKINSHKVIWILRRDIINNV